MKTIRVRYDNCPVVKIFFCDSSSERFLFASIQEITHEHFTGRFVVPVTPDDLNKSLAERIGLTPEMVEAKRKPTATKSDTPKVAKPRTPKASKTSDSTPKKKSVNGSKTKKKGSASKGKSKNPWSSGSEDEDETESIRFNSGNSVDCLSLKPAKTSQNVTIEQLFDNVFGSKPSNSSNLSTSNEPSSPYSVSLPSPSSPEPILQSSSQRSYSPDISTNVKNHETVDISSPQPHASTSKSVNSSAKEPKKLK